VGSENAGEERVRFNVPPNTL